MSSQAQLAPACVSPADTPIRAIDFAPVDLVQTDAPDGTILLRSRAPLAPYEPSLVRVFRAAVETAPSRIFLAERRGDVWRKVTYEEARRDVDAIASALIERGLSADRPVMIFSGNAIDHALLALGAMSAGVPVAPISAAYSLQSQDHQNLKYIFDILTPGLVYVSDTAPFARALAALNLAGTEVVASANGANLGGVTPLDDKGTRGDVFEEVFRHSGSQMLGREIIDFREDRPRKLLSAGTLLEERAESRVVGVVGVEQREDGAGVGDDHRRFPNPARSSSARSESFFPPLRPEPILRGFFPRSRRAVYCATASRTSSAGFRPSRRAIALRRSYSASSR